jgi:hypothetical protein
MLWVPSKILVLRQLRMGPYSPTTPLFPMLCVYHARITSHTQGLVVHYHPLP